MHPQKASGQNAAVKKRAQLAFHKPGDQTVVLPLPCQEGLEMTGHNAVEDALLRPAGAILGGRFTDGAAPARECRIAPLLLHFHLDNGRWIGMDHSHRSTSRSPGATI